MASDDDDGIVVKPLSSGHVADMSRRWMHVRSTQRILRDLANHAFGLNPRFSTAVPGTDLPRRRVWRLQVEPVP